MKHPDVTSGCFYIHSQKKKHQCYFYDIIYTVFLISIFLVLIFMLKNFKKLIFIVFVAVVLLCGGFFVYAATITASEPTTLDATYIPLDVAGDTDGTNAHFLAHVATGGTDLYLKYYIFLTYCVIITIC